MKTYTIGRGDGCDIFIDDVRISRRHALLKVYSWGKMEIVDLGQNGTWVNANRLLPNVPFTVTRKDVINFAEAAQLDWKQVPDPLRPYKWGAGLLAVLAIVFALFALFSPSDSENEAVDSYEPPVTQVQTTSSDSSSSSATGNTPVSKKSRKRSAQELFPDASKPKPVSGKEQPKSSKDNKPAVKDNKPAANGNNPSARDGRPKAPSTQAPAGAKAKQHDDGNQGASGEYKDGVL